MGRTILKFGTFAGLLLICLVFAIATLCDRDMIGLGRAELIGYAGMLIALTMVFLGMRSYREQQGSLTFWKGVQVGLGITAIAAILYFVGGELYNLFNPDFGLRFMKKFGEYQVELARSSGSTEAEIEDLRQQISTVMEISRNPIVRFGIALVEFLPVGVVVTFVCAAILRRKVPAELAA